MTAVAPTTRETTTLRILLLVGLALGFAVRLFQLGRESLWYDETVSVFLARQPVADMLAHTAGDIHPPGYYALLHLWQSISHPTLIHGLEFLYAWPSLAAGILIIALLYPLGRTLLGERTAVIAVWLAAINPFHVWYSQEVRMYTIGAALGLLCLWSTLRFFRGGRQGLLWLGVYVLAAAAGLYTLYYFAFALIALNAIALLYILQPLPNETRARSRIALAWAGAQLAVLLLWLPWLPVFVRQALDPPVPPWRAHWESLQAFIATLSETLGVLIVGQTPPGGRMWPYALVSTATLAFFVRRRSVIRGDGSRDPAHHARATLLLFHFVPLLLLYVLSAWVTPLYHVRYLFIFAPVFLLMLANNLATAAPVRRGVALLAGAAFVVLSGWGLYEYWTNPLYRADDHRGAVAELARNWRPGDAILVNAGWVYPALDVYWPTEPAGPADAVSPPIGANVRFTTTAAAPRAAGAAMEATGVDAPVVILRTGSVDGHPSLGWGRPASDFYTVSPSATTAALTAIAAVYPRIWHYRLYDTVSDPTGLIRTWLEENTSLILDLPYPGRDYLRVQRFDTAVGATAPAAAPLGVEFGEALELVAQEELAAVTAGTTFYVNLTWEARPWIAELGTDLSMSLRLYRPGTEEMVAQQDSSPLPPTSTWRAGEPVRQSLALPIPAATEPGTYSAELIVYRQDSGEPLPPHGDESQIAAGQRWRLAEVEVAPYAIPREGKN